MYYVTAAGNVACFSVNKVGMNDSDRLVEICGAAAVRQYDDWDREGEEVELEVEEALLQYTPDWAYATTGDGKAYTIDLKALAKTVTLQKGASSAINFCTKEVSRTKECEAPKSKAEKPVMCSFGGLG